MSLKDIDLKREYRSSLEDIANNFYIPALKEGILYDRAVGFFSSSIFSKIAIGINELIKNGGKVRLIASPNLSEHDIQAIKLGYEKRDEIIKNALLRELKEPINKFAEEQLNYMANLIADGYLDIKITIMKSSDKIGIYHEKVGIIKDKEGNSIAFTGSTNETITALLENYETIDVYTSWNSDSDLERINDKEKAFESIWEDAEPNLKTLQFKDVTDEFINRYKKKSIEYRTYKSNIKIADIKEKTFLKKPEGLKFYEYQKIAIENWFHNQNCGIFDMATGTGKTFTALGALTALSERLNENLAVVIVAPYQHLVDQWVEDLNEFNVSPIIAYSGSDWRKAFKNSVIGYNLGVIKHFCIITTNATFSLLDFQNILSMFRKNFCFIVDEAHNIGASKIRELLPIKARYRIGLSATIERHMDEEGTDILKKYFGKTSIQFGLKEAIKKGFLTPYYYYPVITYLSEDEFDEYERITRLILQNGQIDIDNIKDNKNVQRLLIKRARIIAGCRDKISKLIEEISKYRNESYILVYCGATKYHDEFAKDNDIRQIEKVTKDIANTLGMRVSKFTADEDKTTRLQIKRMFSTGRELQVITAIKCLDEGVNIPAIRKAFILASSTNPKEYIQRRGRVLRKAVGKRYAEIFDFITLPRRLKNVKYLDERKSAIDISLIQRELLRVQEFASYAINPIDSDNLIETIYKTYKII